MMTMLLSNYHDLQYQYHRGHDHQAHSLNPWTTSSSTTMPSSMIDLISSTTMPQSQQPRSQPQSPVAKRSSPSSPSAAAHDDNRVAQALEIARDSPEACQIDSSISYTLETALAQTWYKIQTHPNTYVMSRAEFAVFNFFQHRFVGNKLATASRKRYWDNVAGTGI